MQHPESLTKIEFITKRELFSAMAMQGLLSNEIVAKQYNEGDNPIIAKASITIADELIKQLNQK